MNDEMIKWRVMTQYPGGAWQKRGLFETQVNAKARAAKFRAEGIKAKVVRHVVEDRAPKCAPAITGGL